MSADCPWEQTCQISSPYSFKRFGEVVHWSDWLVCCTPTHRQTNIQTIERKHYLCHSLHSLSGYKNYAYSQWR